ncbi:MAG TPA: phage holin family protein [Vicinamibacterales bacterium]|nr:phage holin family protein [Vicinamibacterales bacterium]
MAVESERSIAAVLTDIVGNLQQIIRAEVRLAKVEVREEVGKARRGALFMAAGGLLLVLALGAVMLSAIYALALVWPAWAAALAVAGTIALVGGLVLGAGMKQFKDVSLKPPRTVATVQENIQWAKTRAR